MSYAYIKEEKRTLAVIANYNINIRIMTSSVYNHLKIIFSIEAYLKDVFVPCLYMTSKKRKNDIAHEMQLNILFIWSSSICRIFFNKSRNQINKYNHDAIIRKQTLKHFVFLGEKSNYIKI